MKIYTPDVVAELHLLYGSLFTDYIKYPVIFQHLEAVATKHWEGMQKNNHAVFIEINNYHPGHLGRSIEELKDTILTFKDSQTTIANEFGFSSWKEVEELGQQKYNTSFEQAIDNLLAGDIEALKLQIQYNRELLSQRSQYGHQATLLHYVASNGVELWRQQVPHNLPVITQFLLDEGADPKAKMRVYGGEHDVLSLLASGAHPYDAGIMDEMKDLFR